MMYVDDHDHAENPLMNTHSVFILHMRVYNVIAYCRWFCVGITLGKNFGDGDCWRVETSESSMIGLDDVLVGRWENMTVPATVRDKPVRFIAIMNKSWFRGLFILPHRSTEEFSNRGNAIPSSLETTSTFVYWTTNAGKNWIVSTYFTKNVLDHATKSW